MNKKKIRGPGFISFHRNVLENPVMYFHSLMQKYGDLVRCPSLEDIYLVSSPAFARDIFLNVHKNFDKNNFVNNRLRDFMGDGVVLTSGKRWKRQRHTSQLIFKKESLALFVPEIKAQTNSILSAWKTKVLRGECMNVQKEMTNLVLRIMAGCIFNLDNPHELEQLKRSFLRGNKYVSNPIPFNLPKWFPGSNFGLKRVVDGIDQPILRMIAERPFTNKYDGKLLSYIMDQDDENGKRLTNDEVLAETKNVFLSGHFPTTDALCWLVYALAQHPEWDTPLLNECHLLENDSQIAAAVQAQLFIHEVLRLYPPVWGSFHHTTSAIEVGGYSIPKNNSVLVSIFNLHRHPDFWDKPDEFNPSRFDSSKKQFETSAFIPFGFGPRKCLGMPLARMIINMVFAQIIRSFKLSLVDGTSARIQSLITLGAKSDLKIILKVR